MLHGRNLIVFICFLFAINVTNASALKLKGFIGKYPISMNLNVEPHSQNKISFIKGDYSYDKYKPPIKLDGNIDSKFNYVMGEKTGSFKLEREWYCRWSGLSGTWTSESGKILPVKLSILREESDGTFKNGDKYKLVRNIKIDAGGPKSSSTYFMVGNNKIETGADCDSEVGSHSVSSFEVHDQKLHKISWRMNSTANGIIDGGNFAYLHSNGNKIFGGVTGGKFGWNEYSKDSCEISFLDDNLIKTCIHESLSPNDNMYTYKEEKKTEVFSVTEEGLERISSEFARRGTEEMTEKPFEVVRSVEKMPWNIISYF